MNVNVSVQTDNREQCAEIVAWADWSNVACAGGDLDVTLAHLSDDNLAELLQVLRMLKAPQ